MLADAFAVIAAFTGIIFTEPLRPAFGAAAS